MNRRDFMAGCSGVAIGLALPGRRADAGTPSVRCFEMATDVDVAGRTGRAALWLPLAQTNGSQTAFHLAIETGGFARRLRDQRYGAEMLHVSWQAGAARTLRVVQRVAVQRSPAPMRTLGPEERQFWLQPTASIPVDGIVRATADRILAAKLGDRKHAASDHDRLRALYDWVVANTFRDAAARGCGTGDIAHMLETGWLGGKCADINSLMVGLSRAAGIPSRDVYGIRVGESVFAKELGARGDISRAQHCRAEMWLDGIGWFPVDPADLRKLMLEGGVRPASSEWHAGRERLFGSPETNWVGYNSATDIVLPGFPRKFAENFLMYPCAMTVQGQPDCLDPPRFQYRISSRELV